MAKRVPVAGKWIAKKEQAIRSKKNGMFFV